MRYKRARGYTIIESLLYIFITAIILVEELKIMLTGYKSYFTCAADTKQENDIQNFYISLNNLLSEGDYKKIEADGEKLCFEKNENVGESCKKEIKLKNNNVAIKYFNDNARDNTNVMINSIDNVEFIKKDNLVYIILIDEEGKEHITCV